MLLVASKSWGKIRPGFAAVVLRPYSCQAHQWPASASVLLRHRSLSTSNNLLAKRRKGFFSSNAIQYKPQPEHESHQQQQQPQQQEGLSQGQEQGKKRKAKRSPASKTSLRRVAFEAQKSKDGHELKRSANLGLGTETKTITAICAAEQYGVAQVSHLLQTRGYRLDPYGTGLYPQVVHIEIPADIPQLSTTAPIVDLGDVFVFPSGTVVCWGVPDETLSDLVHNIISPAAVNAHPKTAEEEDLEYIIDPSRESSSMKGDTILLGTKQKVDSPDGDFTSSRSDHHSPHDESRTLDTVLAKIAYSSGLARSTKLAVLETLLSNYFQSTKSIPLHLASGGRIPFTYRHILQKTGELLNIRAQLNLYSELTDSLPDLFWDSKHELGLEGYYDQVAKTLDTNIRIKILNQKMDYAQDIASVLRQQLSEKHGIRLEWIIIVLIAVEVGFEVRVLYKEWSESHSDQSKL